MEKVQISNSLFKFAGEAKLGQLVQNLFVLEGFGKTGHNLARCVGFARGWADFGPIFENFTTIWISVKDRKLTDFGQLCGVEATYLTREFMVRHKWKELQYSG
jgi:hypothetical protein